MLGDFQNSKSNAIFEKIMEPMEHHEGAPHEKDTSLGDIWAQDDGWIAVDKIQQACSKFTTAPTLTP